MEKFKSLQEADSKRPRSTNEGRTNTTRHAREDSVVTTACLAPFSEFVAIDVRKSPEGFATSTPGRSLGILCKHVGQLDHHLPLEAATGGECENSAEAFSAPASVITGKESRRMPVAPEPFVSADEAAQFLCVKRRYLLELARRGITGAYALGTGGKRKIWVFRLSELADSVVRNETSIPKPPNPCTIGSGSPR
jgi:hypothetical protein